MYTHTCMHIHFVSQARSSGGHAGTRGDGDQASAIAAEQLEIRLVLLQEIRHDQIRLDQCYCRRLGMTRLDQIRFDSIQINSIRFDSIRFDSIRFNSIRFDSIRLHQEASQIRVWYCVDWGMLLRRLGYGRQIGACYCVDQGMVGRLGYAIAQIRVWYCVDWGMLLHKIEEDQRSLFRESARARLEREHTPGERESARLETESARV